MKETILLITPICIEGNVDTLAIRGLLDILAMNLQTCNILKVRAPLFITENIQETKHHPQEIIQRQLLTWPAEHSTEALLQLVEQSDPDIDMVLVPIVRRETATRFSFEIQLLNPASEYEIYSDKCVGSLVDITKRMSKITGAIISFLPDQNTSWYQKWPTTNNEEALRLFLHTVTFAIFFYAGFYSNHFSFILESFLRVLQLDASIDLASYRLLGFIENLIANPALSGHAYVMGIRTLERLEKAFNLTGPVHTLIAEIYKTIGKGEDFKRNLRIAFKKSPMDEDVVMMMGNYYEDQQKWDKARDVYENYMKSTSKPSHLVLHNLGAILAEQGDTEGAIKLWCQSLKLSPNYAMAYCNLMNAYCEMKEYEKMWVVLEESLKHSPVFWNSYEHIVQHIDNIPDTSSLFEILQNYIREHEDEAGAYFYLGLSYEKENNISKAISIWKKGLRQGTDDKKFIELIGQKILYYKIPKFEKRFVKASQDCFKGNAKRAIVFLEKCIDIVPNFWPTWFLLGKAYQRLKHFTESKNCFEEAHRLGPENSIILNELGLVATFTNDRYYALECFQRASQVSPLNPSYLSNLALAFIKIHDSAKAQCAIERSLAIKPDDQISKNIKAILDGKMILNADGSLSPAKRNRQRRKSRENPD